MKYINKNRFIITILVFSIFLSSLVAFANNAKENISDSVVRLHVIANSDSAFDQSLKLKVRDRILLEASEIFKNSSGPTEALEKANSKSEQLRLVAKEVLKENECNLDVKIETGTFSFPAKNYGEIMLPAGNYNALRIIIGEGKGKNWWCVMFPPLCLAKGTVKLSETSDAYLKTRLSDSEYALITCSENPKVEIRFKLLELFD